jgi:ATP-dependent DNA helicase RecG
MMTRFDDPLEGIKGIGPGILTKLKKLKLVTVRDLLYHFPSRYEDWSEVIKIADLKPGDTKTIQATVKEINVKRTWKRRMFVVEALLTDGSGSIAAVWFNQTYIKNTLKPGVIANFSGKAAMRKQELYLSSPAYEVMGREDESVIDYGETEPEIIRADTKHTARLVPIYPETRGLTSRGLRYLIQPILDDLEPLDDFMPEEISEKEGFPELNDALHAIHFPLSLEQAKDARQRFAFEELFLLQLRVISEKMALAKEKAHPIKPDAKLLMKIINMLPFKLTASQNDSLIEILKDMSNGSPMNRLLQGDVGSGKTIIAGIAAHLAADEGLQVAFMAPTEILARQHYATIKKFFPEFKLGLGLILSKETRAYYGEGLETELKKTQFINDAASGKIAILIGTHALIDKGIVFKDLGLVIVDEQHRFGVKQRAMLVKENKDKAMPHFLSMSATPIPRTLMMTVFGDLDLSIIGELPSGRKSIVSKIVAPENRNKAYAFIRGQVRKGRQGFVICPRIDSEISNEDGAVKLANNWDEVKAVKDEYDKLKNKIFPDLRVGMIHGKLKTAEKTAVMEGFSKGEIDLIVSTSVVEVGVDVPNATIMMIEDADRFGLAQLYQLRGRVGRGEHQSFCFLFTESHSETIKKRLESILTAKNGFELAEKDLEIRGPGEFLGNEQSGMPDIAMRGLQNPALVRNARSAAEKYLAEDPSLEKYPALKDKVNRLNALMHLE